MKTPSNNSSSLSNGTFGDLHDSTVSNDTLGRLHTPTPSNNTLLRLLMGLDSLARNEEFFTGENDSICWHVQGFFGAMLVLLLC